MGFIENLTKMKKQIKKTSIEPPDSPTPPGSPTSQKLVVCEWHTDSITSEHRTDDYVRDDDSLVVRRGQYFTFTAMMSRSFDKDADQVKIDFQYGPNPSVIHGTHIVVEESFNESNLHDKNKWHLTIDRTGTSDHELLPGYVTCSIFAPSNAMIGRYSCKCWFSVGGELFSLENEPDIIILCNPWCENDTVYLPSEEERSEYVLNDTGYIWRGT